MYMIVHMYAYDCIQVSYAKLIFLILLQSI